MLGLRCEGGRSKTLSPQLAAAKSLTKNYTLHLKTQHEKVVGIAIPSLLSLLSILKEFLMKLASEMSKKLVILVPGGRSYRGGGGRGSGKDLQGQPQEEQAEEERRARSATGEDP